MCKSEHCTRFAFNKSSNVYFILTVTRDRSRQYFNFIRYFRTMDNLLQMALLRNWQTSMCFLLKYFKDRNIIYILRPNTQLSQSCHPSSSLFHYIYSNYPVKKKKKKQNDYDTILNSKCSYLCRFLLYNNSSNSYNIKIKIIKFTQMMFEVFYKLCASKYSYLSTI